MCGRFAFVINLDHLAELFPNFNFASLVSNRYNIAPSQSVSVVRSWNSKKIETLQWGVVPKRSIGPSADSNLMNARSESVEEKVSFRSPFQTQRCLILSTGFYEWRRTELGKLPTYIHLQGNKPFAFAGIWDCWTSPRECAVESCSILTRAASPNLKTIHHRMPVIITPDQYRRWLEPQPLSSSEKLLMFQSKLSHCLKHYPVSQLVNSTAVDSKACLKERQLNNEQLQF